MALPERLSRRKFVAVLPAGLATVACNQGGGSASEPAVGVAFETLQTEYWVASRNAIEAELRNRNLRMLEAIADGDANRQFEQVKNFLARKVEGIIIVPKDAQTVIPMIREANRAGVPMVLFNRPPAKSDARSVTVVADNYSIAKETVAWLAAEAMKSGKSHKAAILIGDLGDMNAITRRDGFDDALKPYGSAFQVVSRIPTEWNQEKALAGLTNALQANPDIDFIFTSSDLLLPSVASALKSVGKWKKNTEHGHVFLAGFDGDATAYRMLRDGYVDAIGVQDLYFDTAQTVQAVLDLKAGKSVPDTIVDKGFVMHRGNADETADRMWGAKLASR